MLADFAGFESRARVFDPIEEALPSGEMQCAGLDPY